MAFRYANLVASNPSINGMVRTPQPAAGDRSRVERMSLRKHPPTRHALRLIRDPHLASTEVDGLAGHPNVRVRLAAAEHPQTGGGTLTVLASDPVLGVARAANSRLPSEGRRTDPELAVLDIEDPPPGDWWRTATAVAAGVAAAGVVLVLLGWLLLRVLVPTL